MSVLCQRATSTRSRSVRSGGRDCKLKESTLRFARGRPQPPTMGFDNRPADREAHAHAVGLRRVEGFKETRQALRAQPMAGIPQRDPISYALETDWPVGAAGFEPLHLEIRSAEFHPASTGF